MALPPMCKILDLCAVALVGSEPFIRKRQLERLLASLGLALRDMAPIIQAHAHAAAQVPK
ncbi:hypothetical protein D1O30_09695 [Methylocystis hirsuta]|uniref:Uncharacterized protein n=1 Tax=Methylocystis hirsuta TaxID=369798 RepID=A0A3M9XNE3_9HYPH|nr:hypothetical protein D1O30_09695 [Methylocystis hirsuta]